MVKQMLLRITFAFFLMVLLVGCGENGWQFKSLSFQKIQGNEVKDKMDKQENFKIIDVRDSDEFSAGHIPNSLSLPYDSGHFKKQYPELDWGKDVLIVVVDSYETRAADAAQILRNSGFSQAKVLKGGMMDWQKGKYPIITD